ncbi:response regulator [Geomonas sp. RF6]|uniref:response regulator n=1 Tax=Geomonas sp. RF6 TaxID=2897342 RepID=UPI001E4EE779|nr:response regulator [Geomonas sp. RF6]UFS69909.1 response regulator [Geomonas sp. RF6]
MTNVLVVDKDQSARKMLAELLTEEGYEVSVTGSAAQALYLVLKKRAQVVLLGEEFDDAGIAELVPILKQLNKEMSIILVSDDLPLALVRKVRKEGIFYHVLKPFGRDEIRQAVKCAFANKGFCSAF